MDRRGQKTAPFVWERLSWDTAFFGVSSARLTLEEPLSEKRLSEALAQARGYAFVCIRNRGCDAQNAKGIARLTDAFVVDTNIQFEKRIASACMGETDALLPARDCCPPDAGVLDIASATFQVSRFLADEALKARNGALVYYEWVKNAFAQPGKYFLICRAPDGAARDTASQTGGFALFSVENECLTLELIGVSERYQRCGIGETLWRGLESEAVSRHCTAIHVGTQLANGNALRFYTKMGCIPREATQIYHWWRAAPERPCEMDTTIDCER